MKALKRFIKSNRKYFVLFILSLLIYFAYAVLKADESTRNALVAFATLLLAIVAFGSIMENRRIREEERELDLLNTVAIWAADVRKYCARLITGFNTQLERSEAAGKYLELKFDGKRLQTLVEKEGFTSELSGVMKKTTTFFEGVAWNSLADNKDKLKELDENSEVVIEKAIALIQSL